MHARSAASRSSRPSPGGPPCPPRWRAQLSCRRRDLSRSSCQLLDDRALRPLVAVAVMREVLERAHHRLKLLDLSLQFVDVVTRDALHGATGAGLLLPQAEKCLDVRHAEAKRAS